ncbi:MAG: hypothetical protein SGJ27_26805 [Candidatus Melainabacteria bacterium]|nr:hypothetical protein [Candidatus Melainabacteria bacterium]
MTNNSKCVKLIAPLVMALCLLLPPANAQESNDNLGDGQIPTTVRRPLRALYSRPELPVDTSRTLIVVDPGLRQKATSESSSVTSTEAPRATSNGTPSRWIQFENCTVDSAACVPTRAKLIEAAQRQRDKWIDFK